MTDTLTGRRLGAYAIRDLLGSGGMGSVYRGYDAALDREVAVKVIKSGALAPDAVQRFRREARLAASLRHPNIVQVYTFDDTGDMLYMVQELLPGPTLAEQIRRAGKRCVSLDKVRRVVMQLAVALDYAHERGVVHRDVKPANALYNAAGDLVLTDFGLARPADTSSSAATGPGLVMGTPGYVAPEQAVSSVGLSKACDIYSLGVVTFELLTGRLPFEADTPMGIVLKHLYEAPPPPTSLRSTLPPAVDAVVIRALHKEPERRYSSAGALAAALALALPEARSVNATA
ncbi:serine/threonine protein kinase, partial [Candidatus Gracilibacteria bacterium]|nr:serine/threonine protein kinase [Candidatus Gracilibacteria bacterium]